MGWENVRERSSQFLELYVHAQVKKLLHPGNILSMLISWHEGQQLESIVLFFSYKKTLLHLVFDADVIDSPISGRVIATVWSKLLQAVFDSPLPYERLTHTVGV